MRGLGMAVGDADGHGAVGSECLHARDECGPAVLGRVEQASRLALCAHVVVDAVLVLGGEEVGDIAGREQVVDVHKELLVGDLLVGEQEQHVLELDAGLCCNVVLEAM